MNISPLRVSTMTATAQLGVTIDKAILFQVAPIIPYWYLGEGILKIENGKETRGTCKSDILLRRKKEKKKFFNQCTLVMRQAMTNTSKPAWKEVNVKLFSNGGVQMTGVVSDEQAKATIQSLLDILVGAETSSGKRIFSTTPTLSKYETQLVNSDYSLNMPIRRDKLHRILVQNYGLFATFEPTIYQGVNTKYYWNASPKDATKPGRCSCAKPCEGDGNGQGEGQCKKITIAPFQTGKIIITGARCIQQINDAYTFMNKILVTHMEEIVRKAPPASLQALTPDIALVPISTRVQKVVMIKHPSPRNMKSFLATAVQE